MNDAERDAQQIKVIAALTTAEVKERLRQFGLRPLEHVPPELEQLLAACGLDRDMESCPSRSIEEPQVVLSFAHGDELGTKNARVCAAWAAMRRQLLWLKTARGALALRRTASVSALMLLVVGIAFGVRAVVDHFDRPSLEGVSLLNFTPDEEAALRKELTPLFTRKCTVAFDKAGLKSPSAVAATQGVVIRPSADLYQYSAANLGLANEEAQRAYMEEFSSCRAQAGTVPHVLYGVPLTFDGRPRIFLHGTAFMGESFLLRKLSLHDVLVHEFIHVGGQPPTPGWLGVLQDDLAGFDHYDEVMGACR